MLFRSPKTKRRVPTPQPVVQHRSDNPMFPPPSHTSSPTVSAWRQQVLMIFAGLVLLGSLGTVLYGPWLRITSITITGTVAIQPQSLRQVTQDLLNQQRWLVLPNQNLWLVSKSWLADQIKKKILERLSIEGVDVVKTYPHALTITVHERTPAFRWQSGTQVAIVDRHGIVMSLGDSNSGGLPLVVDQAAPVIQVDQAVIKPEVISALAEVPALLATHQIKWTNFIIPTPVCPTIAAPEPTTTFPTNTNLNTNQPATNTNTVDLSNENTNKAVNADINTNSVIQPPCDLAALHDSSQEIHVQLDHGPEVYFDRHQSLSDAVTALDLILRHPNAGTTVRDYIDLRFLPRVYTK